MPRPALRPRRGPARGLLASGLTAVTAAAMLAMAGPTVAADAAGAAPANSGPASTPSSATGTVTAQAARADARRTFGSDAAASGDRAWTLTGDAEGLHVLLARADEDYTWRQVASLADAGVDTDRWIGQGCLTGSGRRLVVAYGPRALPNSERRFARGARIAVVDLDSGQTRVLPVRGTLAYFNPGCGAGETVAITQDAFVDLGRTRVVTVDAATGAVTRTLELEGQVSSAIPDGAGVVAARGTQVLRFDAAGRAVEVARTKGVATRLTSARDGLYFVDAAGAGTAASGVTNVVRRVADGTDTALATGANGRLDLKRVPDGRVALLGEGVSAKATLPAAVVRWAVPAGSTVSSTARTAVTSTLRAADALASAEVRELDEQSGRDAAEPLARAGAPAAGKDDVTITLAVRSTAARVQETLDADALGAATTTDATGGATGSPAAAPGRVSPAATRPAGSASNPVDADRTCAVARNAASGQVYQPTPRQVEWAADLATVGALTLTRPTDWKQTGLSAWSPQGKFPGAPSPVAVRCPRPCSRGCSPRSPTCGRPPATCWPGSRATRSWATSTAPTSAPTPGSSRGTPTAATASGRSPTGCACRRSPPGRRCRPCPRTSRRPSPTTTRRTSRRRCRSCRTNGTRSPTRVCR
ncbi:MAG: hypothetical protein U0Q15_06045 [Kineosporiaceae bacterium]